MCIDKHKHVCVCVLLTLQCQLFEDRNWAFLTHCHIPICTVVGCLSYGASTFHSASGLTLMGGDQLQSLVLSAMKKKRDPRGE